MNKLAKKTEDTALEDDSDMNYKVIDSFSFKKLSDNQKEEPSDITKEELILTIEYSSEL